MTGYNDGNWHAWNGGECPVHPKTLVDVMFQDGSKAKSEYADSWNWDRGFNAYIISFHVVKEYKEPREFWVAYRFGKYQQVNKNVSDAIHVREVIE